MIEKWIECRYILTFLLTFGMVNAFIMRLNMSVAIVAMVEAPEVKNHTHECRAMNNPTNVSIRQNSTKPFTWDAQTRGWVLSAFYYGYITTPFLGGWLEHRFGGKIVFGLAIFLSSLITLIMPSISYISPWALVAARIALGIVQGPIYPSHHGMWGKWAPPVERSRLMSIAMSGPYAGVGIAYLISGSLANSNFFMGWPSIFYVTGILGVCWSFLWGIFAFDSPEKHPRIRPGEKEYLMSTIGRISGKKMEHSVPWRAILTSPQVWSLFFAHFSLDWGFRNLSINLPSFIDQIMGLDISKNSILSAIPFLVVCIFITTSGWIATSTHEKRFISPINFKRILVFSAQIIPAIFLVAVGHLGCNEIVAVIILTMAVSFGGLSTPSILVNFVEIAPIYAGLLFGMSNTISVMSGQLAPLLVGYVTGNITDLRYAWQIVFYAGACISVLGGLVFMVTVRVDVLPWAKENHDDDEKGNEVKEKLRDSSASRVEWDDDFLELNEIADVS